MGLIPSTADILRGVGDGDDDSDVRDTGRATGSGGAVQVLRW